MQRIAKCCANFDERKNMSKWRNLFWPIYGKENRKFIPMLLMLVFALFNYTSLRITKDTLIMTAHGSGAGVLNFLKGYVVMPMSILFVVFYTAMSNRVSKKNLFYVTLLPFLAFFVVFASILYPLSHLLHMNPDNLLEIQATYPRLHHIAPIFGYWSFSLFYVFSELWGNVVITLLFWQFANLNTTKDEVKRFYPLFGTYANVGLITAGFIQRNAITTELTCILVISSAMLLGVTYWYLNKYVLPFEKREETAPKSDKKKVKLSVGESFKLILTSKYLRYIAILVLAYGMSANLVEVTWKHKVKELYPNKSDYQSFMGNFFLATGICTMFIGFLVKNTIRKFGWLIAALITPIVLLVTSMLFFGFALYSEMLLPASLAVGVLPLIIAAIIGAIQNIAAKGTKYALFDPTTQMTYIPLEDDLRIKGKAAVDVIGGRMGKSLGGHIQSLALILIPGATQITIAPALMGILIVISLWWIYATKRLAKLYAAKLKETGND